MEQIQEPQYKEVIITQEKEEPKQKFTPKIQTSVVARPIFKNNYERYEWHMQNGCISKEDRDWLTNYIKSDEYKTIYE